jgi:dTDP-4-amino-4,6-dideoxygalactose transaminase
VTHAEIPRSFIPPAELPPALLPPRGDGRPGHSGSHLASSPFIPLLDVRAGTDRLRDDLDRLWRTVLGHGRFVDGPEVEEFESRFAEYCGSSHCAGVGSGSDALEFILTALGIGPGDEVILPGNAPVETAGTVCAVGGFPRFVDVLPKTLEIDPAAVTAAINRRTVAIIAVHTYGEMADVDRLEPLAQRNGLALIEDATQAPGATFGERRAGSVGRAAAFGFVPGTDLGALGDGGVVVSDDAELIARVRQLADRGRSADNSYVHEVRGRESRLDTLQAAVLSVKLDRLDDANRVRRTLVQRYRERLPSECVPVAEHPRSWSANHLAVVLVRDRLAVTRTLSRAGIGWGLHYPVPCHRQPAFAEFVDDDLPVAERAAERVLSLPLSSTMTAGQVDRVCEVLARTRRRR